MTGRLDRLHRLRVRLRELAERAAARRVAELTAAERDLAAARADEEASRRVPAVTSGGAVASAWAWADALARRGVDLVDVRVRAAVAADEGREAVRERRRREEQIARLAARATARVLDDVARADARALDALALWSHGRTR